MQKALESLPWVSKADIDFAKKLATVVVDAEKVQPADLTRVLKEAGFDGKVVER